MNLPVGIPRQQAEGGVLGVGASGVEVGRAVGVVLLRGEGMGHEPVDAPDDHVVGQPLHHFGALGPAEGAEHFTQHPALLFRLNVGVGSGQLGQTEGEEIRVRNVVGAGDAGVHVLKARHDLVQHHIHTGHVHAVQRPEVVAAGQKTAVLAVVLHDVADVGRAPGVAPGLNFPVEVGGVQCAHRVHIGRPEGGGQPRRVPPQGGQQRPAVPAQLLRQKLLHLAEGQPGIAEDVRLVAEKALEGFAEFAAVAGVVGLIHRLQQHVHRLARQHVDVVVVADPGVHRENPEDALRQVQRDQPVPDPVRQVQKFRLQILGAGPGHPPVGGDGENVLRLRRNQYRAAVDGATDVGVALADGFLPALRVFGVQQAVCVAGGEMLVVQQPEVHAKLPAPAQNQVQIRPPGIGAEALVGPGLHADAPNAAVVNFLKRPQQRFVVLAVEPEEGQLVVRRITAQILQQPG